MTAAAPAVWLPRVFRHPRVTLGVGVAVVALGVLALVLNVLAPTRYDSRGAQVLYLLGPTVDALVGAYLIRRRPDNPLGHVMVAAGVGFGLAALAQGVLNLEVGPPDGPLREWSTLVDNSLATITFWAMAMLLLLYPDGRLASPAWRWIVRVGTAAEVLLILVGVFDHSTIGSDYAGVVSPLPDLYSARFAENASAVFFLVLLLTIGAALVSQFGRARRARRVGDTAATAQARWLAWSGLLAAVLATSDAWIDALVAGDLPGLGDVVSSLWPYPPVVALVVAVTRHGLFDIDRIVSRTVTYAAVLLVLAGVYVGVVAGLAALVPAAYGQVGVAAATLVVAALAVPFTRRVRHAVDRRFDRARFDAQAVVEGFAGRVRSEVGAGDLHDDLLLVVGRTVSPVHAGLWLVGQ